jgi:hypothetical protein
MLSQKAMPMFQRKLPTETGHSGFGEQLLLLGSRTSPGIHGSGKCGNDVVYFAERKAELKGPANPFQPPLSPIFNRK